MSAIEKRNQYAAQILAGFAANPAIFAHNSQCGWSLVNCTDDAIAAYAVRLANALLGASDAIGLDWPCAKDAGHEGPCSTSPDSRTSKEKFLSGIRPDGTVEGYAVETHYMVCKGAMEDDGFLRVIVDGPGYDIETRVLDETLKACGYARTAPEPETAPSPVNARTTEVRRDPCTRNAGESREAGEAAGDGAAQPPSVDLHEVERLLQRGEIFQALAIIQRVTD